MKIWISGACGHRGRAVAEARRMAGTAGLSAEDSMHLQLLAEEMLSMARSVTGELEASFWVEYRGSRFDLYMTTRAVLDKEKRHQLITSSSERRNEITGTFLGRLRDAFEEAMAADTERVCLSRSSGAREAGPAGGAAQEQGWDRFERSILLKLADDVKVAIRGGEVRLTVSRDFGKPS